jgi:RNA polymerase sigma-70 factor (ECF subfamily)
MIDSGRVALFSVGIDDGRPEDEGVAGGGGIESGEGVTPARKRVRDLVDAHFDFIWRSLRRLGVPDASVDDAAQKVFYIALRRLEDIEAGRERAFLFSTAMNVAADTRRALARRREQADEQALDTAVDSMPTPDEVVDRKEARALLDEVLDSMDPDLRAVFILFEIEGMTSPEIASLLGIPLGTAASRLRRSREQFHAIAKRVRARAFGGGGAR